MSARGHLQLAADAAALAARAEPDLSSAQLQERAARFFSTNVEDLSGVTITSVTATPAGNDISVNVEAKIPSTFAALIGSDHLNISVTSRATASTDDLELALVLDNTGSMAPHMDELRQGARDLVQTLFDRAGDVSKLKIAVVPYVGGVNIGNAAAHRNWLDLNADARHSGEALEWRYFGYEPGCVYTGGSGPLPDPGTGAHGSVWDLLPSFATIIERLDPIGRAQAASPGDVSGPYNFVPDCWIAAPSKINTLDYLDSMTNTEWKGCVEARAEPFDVTDDPPSVSNPDTLFVPWFWPDEIDHAATASWGWYTNNDYLPDRLDLRDASFPVFTDAWPGWGFGNVMKYAGAAATVDEVAPDTLGPNKACPDSLLPLTNSKSAIDDKINNLMHWNGSGTVAPEGLAWGWRVLSPSEPFTEGKPYGKANKVIVLMTDGVNNADPQPNADLLSDYTAYGYLQQWGTNRIADKTYAGFKTYADNRLAQVCANAKAEGIAVYTVAFGITDQVTLDLLKDCASGPPYAYTASTSQDLITAFQNVAAALSKLRLAQ